MKKNWKKYLGSLFAIGAIGLCFLLLASCAPAATPTTAPAASQPTSTSATSTEPIIFGVAGPMTGDAAEYGTQQMRGLNIALAEINAAGGINGRQVKLNVCDDQCDPTQAALCAQKFTSDPTVFAVIGHVCSSATLAAAPIYDKAGLTEITASSTNPDVTNHGWTHVFRTIANDGQQGPLMAQLAIKTLGKTKIAIIYGGNDYGKGLETTTVPAIKAQGGTVVDEETYTPGVDKDFTSQLTKIAQQNPDALMLLTDYAEGGLIAKQRMNAGLDKVIVIAAGGNSNQGFIDLGGQGAEGVFMLNYFDPNNPNPLVQTFVQKYQAKYNAIPSTEIAAYNYEALFIYKAAIEAGATKETLPTVLHSIKYTGMTGVTQFGPTGDVLNKGQFILIVKDGKFASYVPPTS